MEIEKNNIKNELKPMIDNILKINNLENKKREEFVTFFFSFDIVNSTKYKTKNKGKWAFAISEILRHIISDFANSPSRGFQFWKTLGDEIIYTKNIGTIDEVYDTLDEVYKSMVTLNQKIDNGIICDLESGKTLSIKATAWIAAISDDCQYTDNIYTEYQINDNRRQVEYIGPDIDIGFRASQYSMKNRLVVSFALASLLRNYYIIQKKLNTSLSESYEKMFSKVNLVTFKVLKGVWDESPYPIFMYHGDDSISFNDSIAKELTSKTSIFNEYICTLNSRVDILKNTNSRYEEYIIDCLTKENGYQQKIKRIVKIIRKNYHNTVIDLKPLEKLHASVLAYIIKEGKIKIVLFKNELSNKWNLGDFEIYYSFGLLREIKECYWNRYGLKIEFLNNTHYYGNVPICLFQYDHLERCVGNHIKGYAYLVKLVDYDINELENNSLLKIVDADTLLDYIDNTDEQRIGEMQSIIKSREMCK